MADLIELSENAFLIVNDEDVEYSGSDWQIDDATSLTYVPPEPVTGGGGFLNPGDFEVYPTQGQALTTINRGRGSATVRTNVPLTFNTSIPSFAPYGGRYSGSMPAGAVFTGPDRNLNGVPDLIENGFKKGQIKVGR